MKYAIVPYEYLLSLDFTSVNQNDQYTCRKSIDGEFAVISWSGRKPSGMTWEIYTLDEIKELMKGENWAE